MFTSMRNVLKDESLPESKLSNKSQSDPSSKQDHSLSKRDNCKNAQSKLRKLKKEQTKLKQTLETKVAEIKNIFYQLDEVFHNQGSSTEEKKQPLPSGDYD